MTVTLVRAVILLGTVYFVIGYGSATLDPSVPDQMRFMWRLAAWVATAAFYAAHIGTSSYGWATRLGQQRGM